MLLSVRSRSRSWILLQFCLIGHIAGNSACVRRKSSFEINRVVPMITLLKRFSLKRNFATLRSVRMHGSADAIHDAVSSDELRQAVEAAQKTTSGPAGLWIEPDSELTHGQSLLARRKIESGVFLIGRRGSGYLSDTSPLPDFALPENEPFTVSKRHCELCVNEQGVVIRDLGSRFGTVVDGIRLGGSRRPKCTELLLEAGEHTLVIGPRDSDHRFRLIVE